MRHHRRAEDADREQDGAAACEPRHDGVPADGAEIGLRLEELDDVAARRSRGRSLAIVASSGRKPNRCSPRMRNAAIAVRIAAGKSPIPNRRCMPSAAPRNSARSVAIAIASACSQSADRQPPREPVAADLGEVPAGRDPELRGERLDEHRHQVRGDDHPDERVAVPRAARDVRREVARVDVGDGRDERRAEEGQEPEARRAAEDPLAAIDRFLAHRHES